MYGVDTSHDFSYFKLMVEFGHGTCSMRPWILSCQVTVGGSIRVWHGFGLLVHLKHVIDWWTLHCLMTICTNSWTIIQQWWVIPCRKIHSHCVQVDENWFQEHSGDPTNCVVTLYVWHELSLAIMGHYKQAYLHTGFCTYRYLDSMVKLLRQQILASLQRISKCGIDATSNCCTSCGGLTY